MSARLPEEVPLRSSARLHGVKLSQAVFDDESLRSTPRKVRKPTKSAGSAAPAKRPPELAGLEEPDSGAHKRGRSRRKARPTTPTSTKSSRPKARAKAKKGPARQKVDPVDATNSPSHSAAAAVGRGSKTTVTEPLRPSKERKRKSVMCLEPPQFHLHLQASAKRVHSSGSKARGVRLIVEGGKQGTGDTPVDWSEKVGLSEICRSWEAASGEYENSKCIVGADFEKISSWRRMYSRALGFLLHPLALISCLFLRRPTLAAQRIRSIEKPLSSEALTFARFTRLALQGRQAADMVTQALPTKVRPSFEAVRVSLIDSSSPLPSLRSLRTRRPAEARRGGQGVLGRAVPMGLMAAGVVSGMIIAYFYPALRELPHRL